MAGHFLHHAQRTCHGIGCLAHRRGGQAGGLAQGGNIQDGVRKQRIENLPGRPGQATQFRQPCLVLRQQLRQRLRRADGLIGGDGDGVGKEQQPCLPVAADAYLLQQAVVGFTMLFEKHGKIQQRFLQNTGFHQYQRYQHAAEAAIAIQEGMEGRMVSNCTCESAALMMAAVGCGTSLMKFSSAVQQSASWLAGGGTNITSSA